MYADYAFYSGAYAGAAVSESDFPALARDASNFIDRVTFGRLKTGAPVTDEVRMATCAVIDRMQAAKQSGAMEVNAAVRSENNDGFSQTFNTLSDIRAQFQASFADAAATYLLYTGLMDRSVT
ncbi:hypothetical protein [Ethanoligenens harbinense]|uniref:Uncharacterized protein n=1 Tax=Ethanoligenens harbinense (strain DSM 18485 / JCM 12961 / CGMCC 1.5033 / YUAN-3) TaxID=663278 RepID=E6U916_ETHHY|nr:hypothetical protein [Ethanoligenens harbinense]ADU26080.1 hypothetical protein Ethha_0495 [Ethanoligenens harbinense YUAN-3]AVQ95223.1 hypothetical protein CXQ68_02570 [Ethanoligenens harbinense YUAN-3]AYF37914.1 hypothetical protein CXP51_02585 [Ethanoligenens harbinense]AYF40634.1 hypothetical protein CN246_02570 [Ethanoligenens harbinense]QCN91468.1 hypothetical protein DRA42_02580 [Ethanoligenens harbinense]